MSWLFPTEREKWATALGRARMQSQIGLPAMDARSRALYEIGLPRGLMLPRFQPDRPPLNYWMAPGDLLQHRFVPGQIIIGKLANSFIGYLDDRPKNTIAGARAGKTSTVLEPNLYLYPGSMLVLDPKGELARKAASLRRALGHDVYVLDPFGQSGQPSASFNPLAELDATSSTIVDDVSSLTQALIVDDGDSRAQHWNSSARTLLMGIILLTLLLPAPERNLVTVRQLLSLTHPWFFKPSSAPFVTDDGADDGSEGNKSAVRKLLQFMAQGGDRFGGILAATGRRFLHTPQIERGSVFSTASAQTDFLDSLPLREILRHSNFSLGSLRSDRPTTIFLCLPVGRMESHYRWLRLLVQMACIVLERMGTYPRDRAPILFMMEEFAVLGHMEIMERAAAYFPGFGVKLWCVSQDITQLQRNYSRSWETFLGNSGLLQCFAINDEATLDYVSRRMGKHMSPFEIRTAFSREQSTQILMMEGKPPAAAMRLDHEDVEWIRVEFIRHAQAQSLRIE
jgi:type IV secretion system protein VirD4